MLVDRLEFNNNNYVSKYLRGDANAPSPTLSPPSLPRPRSPEGSSSIPPSLPPPPPERKVLKPIYESKEQEQFI